MTQFVHNILDKLRSSFSKVTSKKRRKKIFKQLIKFTKIAFSPTENIQFLGVSICLLLLPGQNYYQTLTLHQEELPIRKLSIDLSHPAFLPLRKEDSQDPFTSAKAAIVVDVQSAMVLYEKNPDELLLPASTTKIMTALVSLDHFDLDDVVVVKRADRSIGQTMNLIKGEQLRVEDLLYGLLLHSGNDAAYALAENYEGGYIAFVHEMNTLTKKYHLENTQFQNVSGLDQVGHYTTAKDLARLTAVAMKHPVFNKIVATKTKTVTDISETYHHVLQNKNELLHLVEGIKGVKTGWTEQAGECLVTDTERNGNEIIVVILGSKDRFTDSRMLIEWAFNQHQWVDLQELYRDN